jgi:Kef-type K+ transport system membrane component KefB
MISSLFNLFVSPILATETAALPLSDPIYKFSILILIIFLAPLLASRLKIPFIVVLMIMGCVIGTNVLGVLPRDASLILLEKIGLLYIMLIAGIQMDLSNLKRLGVRALVFGLLTFGVPFTFGLISSNFIGGGGFLTAALFGILYSPHTLVSYPIVARLGIARKEAIGVAVGGTMVTSVLTLTGLSIVQANTSGAVGIWLWIKLGIFLPLLVAVCLWGIPKVGAAFLKTTEGMISSQFLFIFGTLFVIASLTQLLGIDPIVGAFIAGLSLNPVIPLEGVLMDRIEFVGNSLFIPAFIVSIGVLCNPKIFISAPENLGIAGIVILGAVGGKFVAAWITGIVFKYSFLESLIMFSLTMSRAALVLVVALFGKEGNLINEGVFNAVVAYILITCLFGPILTNIFSQQMVARGELAKQQ